MQKSFKQFKTFIFCTNKSRMDYATIHNNWQQNSQEFYPMYQTQPLNFERVNNQIETRSNNNFIIWLPIINTTILIILLILLIILVFKRV